METIRTLKVFAKEIAKDKQKFITCSALIADKWYKIKFNKECTGIPRERGVYDITIDIADTSYQRGAMYTNKKGESARSNDIIWIKSIKEIRKYTDDELREQNREVMLAVFDGSDLPF